MSQLTEKEQRMLDYIKDNIENNGYSPSIRDIRTALGIGSTSTVHTYLARLEKKGYIQKENGKSRTLRIEGSSDEQIPSAVRVPILGTITAGMPILAVENHEGYVSYSGSRPVGDKNDLFALRVRGESMIEAGILNGDIVIVERTPVAENGEIIVALIDDEATVKTFYKEDGRYRLQPENKTMEPIIVDSLSILGKVISSVRFYD